MGMTPLSLLNVASQIATDTYSEFGLFQPDRSRSALEAKYTNEHSAFVDACNARVHYRDEGNPDGPTLLLLHGTYSSLHTWDGWVDELGEEFRLVRIDMPGFGLTGPARTDRQTLDALIDCIGAFCESLELSDVTLVGNSLGGGIAWRLATERPECISRLILINAGGATLLSTLSSSLVSFGTNMVPRYVTPRILVRALLDDAYYDSSKVTGELVRRYHDLLLYPGNRRAVLEIAQNYKKDYFASADEESIIEQSVPTLPSSATDPKPSVWDEYDIVDVSVPTLFQWGCEDEWLPCSFGRQLAAPVEKTQFVVYDEVGHVAMEEAPVRTAVDAAAFVRGEDLDRPTGDCEC